MTNQFLINRSNTLADLAYRIKSYHKATIAALKSSAEYAINAGELLIEPSAN